MRYLTALMMCVAVATFAVAAPAKKGSAELKSVTAIAFNGEGVLFIGDSTAAKVYAVETGEAKSEAKGALKVEKLKDQIGGMLGVPAAQVTIADLKVNPVSGNVFLAVRRGDGPDAAAAILKVTRDGKISEFGLKDVMVSSIELPNAVNTKRSEAITSLGFANGKLIVAGTSNEEFASTLRVIPFPFGDAASATGVKIYHGAHGAYETQSPVRTFTTLKIGNAEQVIAAYQCTPLVKFPVGDLQPGNKVTGTTIAELGNRNRPLDMIVYKKDGKDFVLIANSARGIMKISGESLATNEGITTKIPDKAGVKYETVEGWKDVMQLDKLDDAHAVILTDDKKTATLASVELP